MTFSRLPAGSRRERRRHRGLFCLAVLVTGVAAVGGGFVAVNGYLKSPGPGSVVTSYFAALADGHASGALSYGSVPAGTRAYLNADVLREQLAIAPIGPVNIDSVSQDKKQAQVSVSYQLRYARGAVTVKDVVPMIKRGRQWRLTQAAVPTKVGLAGSLNRAALAKAAIPSDPVPLFPGALPITFDTPNLQLSSAGSAVLFSAVDHTGLAVLMSANGIKAVRAALTAALTECLTATAAGSPLCPLPGGTVRAVPGTLRGAVKPTAIAGLSVELTPDADGRVNITGTVDVDGHYQSLDFNNIATTATGPAISVPISARCFAFSPQSVTWTAQ
jgi:hypothetical protein